MMGLVESGMLGPPNARCEYTCQNLLRLQLGRAMLLQSLDPPRAMVHRAIKYFVVLTMPMGLFLSQVWNALKSNTDNSEQPLHEIDVLAGHENDVNYVQFSGCVIPSKSSFSDSVKEETNGKFKNSWFCHNNIVTCSRDGSAIIWVPRSHKFHGKVGRWTRAYHLKVPPPPLPPQPPRGGPRQRFLPTVWSLDNRFVLAAIMGST